MAQRDASLSSSCLFSYQGPGVFLSSPWRWPFPNVCADTCRVSARTSGRTQTHRHTDTQTRRHSRDTETQRLRHRNTETDRQARQTHTHTHTHAHTHRHIHIHIHIHIHMHMHTNERSMSMRCRPGSYFQQNSIPRIASAAHCILPFLKAWAWASHPMLYV